MRKAIALPLTILAALFLIALCSSSVLNQNAARWRGQLQQAAGLAQIGAWDRAEQLLEESYEDWSGRQTYLRIVSTHDAVDAAEELYVRALIQVRLREREGFLAETAGLRAQLLILADMERLSIRNIL